MTDKPKECFPGPKYNTPIDPEWQQSDGRNSCKKPDDVTISKQLHERVVKALDEIRWAKLYLYERGPNAYFQGMIEELAVNSDQLIKELRGE